MAGWLTAPVQLHSSREFECGDFTTKECDYYQQRWHFWYIADYVFALPTVAFFVSGIGLFIIGHTISAHILGYRKFRGPLIWQKLIATIRYLSYRGFHVKALRWNTAPVGILLLGLAGATFFFCMDLIPQPYYWSDEKFGGSPPLATRSGWMALACMPFVFATASKTNWITLFTGVSHERLQVFHRWIAYAFFVLALLHTFPFIVYHIHWHDMVMEFQMNLLFYWTGIVALIFQAWLTFASHSTIRGLGYEFFKAAHLFAAVLFILMLFWHCDYILTSWDYFIATAAVYVPCCVYPWLRTCFEYGLTQKAQLFVEDNDFIRIVIPAKFHWKPGQHCFLRFTSFGLKHAVSAHPFTICSTPSINRNKPSELVFYIRHQSGFTASLYAYASQNPGSTVSVWVDGPYGGINLQQYHDGDHLLVVAGGSGAGWCLPFIERFLKYGPSSTDAEQGQICCCDGQEEPPAYKVQGRERSGPTSLHVILATRDTSSRLWFERVVAELLAKHPERSASPDVHVQVYLTGEAAQKVDLTTSTGDRKYMEDHTSPERSQSDSSSNHIGNTEKGAATTMRGKEYEGRPHLPHIVHAQAAKAAEGGESLSVYVCGPETMQNDVRNAVARENLSIMKGSRSGGMYLHSEHFSWA